MTSEAIFTFTEDTYIETVWFVAWDQTDWAGVIFRDSPSGPWRARYRFRYYQSEQVFHSGDRKSSYHIETTDTSDEARDTLHGGFELITSSMVKSRPHAKKWIVPIRGGIDRFLAEISTQPWAHIKATQERRP